jgi:hypothetical protein
MVGKYLLVRSKDCTRICILIKKGGKEYVVNLVSLVAHTTRHNVPEINTPILEK